MYIKINPKEKKKSSLSNTERKINIAEALCSALNIVILIGKQVSG